MQASTQKAPAGSHAAPRIFLIGLSGSGKSTVAPLIAMSLGWAVADSDRLVEQRDGRTVAEIFAAEGEAAFRALEADVLADLSRRDQVVVATGGGAITTAAGRAALATGHVVWLAVPPSLAAERLAANPGTESRPLLAGGAEARLAALNEQRAHLYALADARIDGDSLSPEELARCVIETWAAAATAPVAPGRLEPQ